MNPAKRRFVRVALAAVGTVAIVAAAALAFGLLDNGASRERTGNVASAKDGFGEGIKVHGDWVIEVRNADGALAERREFQNVLIASGEEVLGQVLARDSSVGPWGILTASNSFGVSDACLFNNQPSHCLIRETGDPWPDVILFQNATQFTTLAVGWNPPPAYELVLQGSFNAQRDGNISAVHTYNCPATPPSLSATACVTPFRFTGTGLATPVNVLTGQQVLVMVRITFS